MRVTGIDHIVLTVASVPATVRFYERVLGARMVLFGQGRTALQVGEQKINLHQAGEEVEPHAQVPVPGSADLCLLTGATPEEVVSHLRECGVEPELGPVGRTGAQGPIRSVYLRDPDGNLVEVASCDAGVQVTPGGRAARLERDEDGHLVATSDTVVTDDVVVRSH